MNSSKTILHVPLLMACILAGAFTNDSKASRTIFIPRSITTDSVYELGLVQYDRYHSAADSTWHLYIKPFFLKTTNKCNNLAPYFLPNFRSCISVDEAGGGDINPLWFNVIAPTDEVYTSNLCINPQRKAYGAVFTFFADFCDNWWFGINMAAMKAQHNLNVCESNRVTDGTCAGFKNMCDGLNNPAWCAAKLPCCCQTRIGVDDVQFKLGYDYYKCEDNSRYSSIYFVATAPTARQKCFTNNIFEPFVGSRHASVGVGLNGGTTWQMCDDHQLTLMLDVKYRYVLKACERRTFDLCNNGDWSRYLLVVPEAQLLNSQPGVNLLTLPEDVTPGSTVDVWAALNYSYCSWTFEVGYDFWWRQAEKLCANCSPASNFGIQSFSNCNPLLTSSASTANITQGASGTNVTVNDATFTPITLADVNLLSGAQPRSLSNTIYGDVAYNLEGSCYSLLFGFGASYEFATKNALNQWGVWYTQGVSF